MMKISKRKTRSDKFTLMAKSQEKVNLLGINVRPLALPSLITVIPQLSYKDC